MRTKLLATVVATVSLIALQASAFAQTAPQARHVLHPAAPSANYAVPTGRPLYNRVAPQQFNSTDDYGNGYLSGDAASRGGVGH
jgi:hypothetical protein